MLESPPLRPSQTCIVLQKVDSIAQSVSNSSDFLQQLFPLMSSVVRAENSQLWQFNGSDLVSLASLGADSDRVDDQRVLVRELGQNLVPTYYFFEDPSDSALKPCCLIAPIMDGEHCVAVATFIVTASNPDKAEAYLAMLMAIIERCAKFFIGSRCLALEDELIRNSKAQGIVEGIGKNLDLKKLAYDVVNRLQHYLIADRVSLVICRGNSSQVKGISNQAVFDRRSSVVKQLETLAVQVTKMEAPLIYPRLGQEFSPSLTRLLERYFEVAHSVGIVLLPIFAEPPRRDDPEDIAKTIQSDEERKKCIGVLILEGIEKTLDVDQILRRWSRIETPISNAVSNSRTHDGLFLMPVWRLLGHFADLYRGHTRRKALIISAVVAAALLSLVLVKGDFKVRGEGIIQPIVRQHLYAEAEGTIEKLLAAEGAEVKKGDLLISLRNPELASRVAEVAGKLRESEAQLQTVTLQRAARSFTGEQEERELIRTASTAVAKISGLKEQLELLQRTQQQLEIHSPINGEVITWNVEQRLRDRPVKPGQRLLTVAVPSGGWEVELRIPDKRAGYLLKEWQESSNSQRAMVVSFVLTSDATRVFQAPVIDVSPSSDVDDKDSENVVRVRVRLDEATYAELGKAKPGTTVIGHVHCGTASLGYCKLYEFFDWIQRVWFQFVA
jgi:multidrug efflux pump subunit AcrA (membrane-fusion protein)